MCSLVYTAKKSLYFIMVSWNCGCGKMSSIEFDGKFRKYIENFLCVMWKCFVTI